MGFAVMLLLHVMSALHCGNAALVYTFAEEHAELS